MSETGSTLLYPLFQKWAPAYHSKYPNITITPQGTGSGTGISQAEAGTVNIGASDAYLPPSAFTAHPGIENIPLAISAQQVNYNLPGIPAGTHLKLNGSILAKMYTGKITNWNDPAIKAINPGVKLPNMKVVPLHRSDGSGDTFIFTTYMTKSASSVWKGGFGTSVTWPSVPGALAANGNGGMVTTCGATPGCVAYIGISFLAQTQGKGLGEAMLQNRAGKYLLPTATTIRTEAAGYASKTPPNEAISLVYGPASGGYPIINYEYAIVSTSQANSNTAAAMKAFFYWAMDPAGGSSSSFLSSVNFQALPSQVVKLSDAQIAKIH
ncbi:MAG: phosphate ABC transporter substrate-binding protein PstS [Actinomycetota bacterium]|nr:phosphate ABC transporter substrate-binding protein PstS [Actinomycetota bacterium]